MINTINILCVDGNQPFIVFAVILMICFVSVPNYAAISLILSKLTSVSVVIIVSKSVIALILVDILSKSIN